MAERGRLPGLLLGATLVACLLGPSAQAEPSAGRQDELLHRLRHDCGSCHGMTLKGGLGPSLLPAALADRTEEDLAAVILHGAPGTPMPPWAFELSDAEARWLARRLKQGLDDAG